MEQIIWAAIGVGGTVGAYVVYLGITKGVPAALTMIKGWFTAGKAELVQIEEVLSADIQALVARVEALEGKLASVASVAAPAVTPVGANTAAPAH